MIDIGAVRLIDLVPPNLREDEKVRAAAESIDLQLRRVTELIPQVAIMYNIDTLPEAWVDELAWQQHTDFYNPELPLEQKREIVNNAQRWHRIKGTPTAVEELITTVFGSGSVTEWYEYGGQPGYFKVTTSDPEATTTRAQEFLAAINSAKRLSSWLEAIEISKYDDMPLYFGNAIHKASIITCEQVT
ncbi:phage tail protein I [Paenibacillus sp. GCM10027626]|uniref:phage tail protein I n=1 Tax=Paenibacillus sp. GCM10027626 TaxID=3273411 RepID=UPI003638E97C